MRDTIIGLVGAIVLLAGLFGLSKYDPAINRLPTPAMIADSTAAKIQPGFKGAQQIGAWVMACAPTAPNTPDMGANTFGRCRLNLIYRSRENPKQVVLLMTMRLVGAQKRLALIVVLPPIVKQGDELDLRAGQRLLRLPVSVCKDSKCVSVVALAPQGETELLAEKNGVLVFPPTPAGKRTGVLVPFIGLQSAVAAMRRAESA